MKKLFYLGLMALFFACNSKPPKASISGSIQNSNAESLVISSQLWDTKDTLMLKEGKFQGDLLVKEPGIYEFSVGKYGFQMYLKPGAALTFNIDMDQLKAGAYQSIQINGEGSAETQLMFDLKSYDIMGNFRQTLMLPSADFKAKVDEYYGNVVAKVDSFKEAGTSSSHFLERIDLITKIEMCEKYMYYTLYHSRLAPQDTTPIPVDFYSIGDDIALDNAAFFKEISTYKYFVLQKHESNIEKQLDEEGLETGSADRLNKRIDLIVSLQASQEVKDMLGRQTISSYTYATEEEKTVYKNRYKEMIKNLDYIQDFETLLSKLESLKPGNVAPTFSYQDVNGQLVSSEDLKGKVIYIDVWATWCGPCRGEIPHLKAMEEELHHEDIAFVSISIDGDKDAWKKMVAEKELKGYQLYADKEWNSDIIKNYAIKGIPRFILIDKEGKIVDANAQRPSSQDVIKKQLIELANS